MWLPDLRTSTLLLVGASALSFTLDTSGRVDPPAPRSGELSKQDWAGIRAAREVARHAAFPVDGGYRARNPRQGWVTRFDGIGFLTEPDGRGWTWGLELDSYGFAGSERPVSRPERVRAEGGRIAYGWDATLEEWYVNDTRGLEHGYTVSRRPEGAVAGAACPLRFHLSVRGDLRAETGARGRDVKFVDERGETVVSYAGLLVYDADGRELDARFDVDEGLRLSIDERGARYPLTIDPIAQQAYLKASNAEAGDAFGWSVAVAGDTVVVGAHTEDSGATGVNADESDNSAAGAGAVYVFVRNGSSWSQQAYLKASNAEAGDLFGFSVAISGDTVVVGAKNEGSSAEGVDGDASDNGAAESGAAYVFVRSGTTWSQEAYLKASNTDPFDQFGFSVAVSGDTVVVGAPDEESATTGVNGEGGDNTAPFSGAAYVFVRSDATWSHEAYLKASNTEPEDIFGETVAISGDIAVVGAPWECGGVPGDDSDNSQGQAGAAYVFVRSDETWTQEAYLKASDPDELDLFGRVAVSGDTLVVGALGEDSSATGVNGDPRDNSASGSGAAFVFVRNGTTWSEQAYLKASNTDPGDLFGAAVAISQDTIVVGARKEDSGSALDPGDNGAIDAGAVFVFVRNGTTWNEEAYLKASNVDMDDEFGWRVAASGGTVVASTWQEASSATGVDGDQDNDDAANSGAVYVFDANSAEIGARYCSPAVPNSSGQPGSMAVFGSTTVSDNSLVLSATDLPTGPNIGYFIMGTGTNSFTPPGSTGPICVSPGLKRYLPPVSNTNELPGGFSRNVGTSGPISGQITPGSTWNFQAWHRDGMNPSNLTDAVSVVFN